MIVVFSSMLCFCRGGELLLIVRFGQCSACSVLGEVGRPARPAAALDARPMGCRPAAARAAISRDVAVFEGTAYGGGCLERSGAGIGANANGQAGNSRSSAGLYVGACLSAQDCDDKAR